MSSAPPARCPGRSALDAVAQLDEANRRLRALLEFGRETRAQLDLAPLLELVTRSVGESCRGCAGALVAIYDASLGEVSRVQAGGAGLVDGFSQCWRQAANAHAEGEGTELRAALAGGAGAALFVDVARDPRLHEVRDLLVASGIGSAAAVPLLARDELQGLLVAYFASPDGPDADEVAYLAAMGEEVAMGVHNARLYAQSRRELRRRDALRRVVESISSELDLHSLLERVAASTVELLEATGGSITLFDEDGRTARMRAVHNLPAELVNQPLAPGQGITGLMFSTRAPVVVADYAHDLPVPLKNLDHLHAAIAVPVWWQGRLVGGFAVFDAQPSRVFDDNDREIMELLANHVAVALENARLYGELQSHVQQLLGLQKVSTTILEEHDFDRVLQTVCEQVLSLTDASGVGLALLEEQGRYLELRTVVGPSAELLRGARVPIEGSFAGEALRTNQPQRSDDAPSDPRAYLPSIQLGGTRTLLSVPMRTRQRAVGVLSIYNKRGEGATFTERDAELATLFARQAAVAIENARLYEQTREYAVVEERNRLARDLHDSVTQSLFSVTLLSQTALHLWDRDAAKARERLERANELANGALAEMRALIFELRPMALQEEGLIQALKKHLAALRNREGLVATLQVHGPERRLPYPQEEAAFRITQESLNNVSKHAKAAHTTVTLTFEAQRLRICVEDDGVGFSHAQPRRARPTLGMASMRERAEAVGGSVQVDSAPGKGTRVLVELPIPPA